MTSTVQRTGVRLPLTLNEKRPQFLQRGCEHRASPLLAASWTGRMDYPTNHLRGSKITAEVQLAANGRRCPGVSSGPACGKNGTGRVNGTSPTDQAAKSG